MYVEYLGKLSAIIEDYESSKVGIIDDFNAAVGSTFKDDLLEVCTHHELIISDYKHFGRNSNNLCSKARSHTYAYNNVCLVQILQSAASHTLKSLITQLLRFYRS